MHTKSLIRFITIGSLAAFAALASLDSQAAEKATPAPAATKEKKSDRAPFHGKLQAVDRTAQTITLEGKEKKRTIHLTGQTRIAKAGKPATLDDALVGEVVAGQILKTTDGREEAISLRLGEKPEEKPKEKTNKKEKTKEAK